MRIFGSLLLLIFQVSIFAQSVFVAPMAEIGEANKLIRLGYGISGGIRINRWVVGAYGMRLAKVATDEHELTLTSGGTWLAYQQPATDALTVNLGMKTAFGNVQQKLDASTENDRVWIFTPEAGVELALGKSLRLSYAAGYRIVGDLQLSGLQNRDFYSLVNTLALKIGRFKR